MINVNLRSYIKGATPEDIFDALSDPQGLKALMPRMRKIEYRDEQDDSATVVMHIAIGSTFGTVRCEGKLSWEEPKRLTFVVKNPLSVETQWTLAPAVNGTEMLVTMALDLVPMLGKMAHFVPKSVVEEMMVKEMKHAITQIPALLKERASRERAAAA